MASDTQAQILRISIGLFAQKGFEGVSMRDIAGAAGAKLATIYHHFPDKQALYDAALGRAMAYMTEGMVSAARSEERGERRLRSFLRDLVMLQMSDAPEVRLVDRELL